MNLGKRVARAFRAALNRASLIEPERLDVRKAAPGDLDRLLALIGAFAREQNRRWGIPEVQMLSSCADVRRALGDPRSLVLVGTIDGAVVAYAMGGPYDSDMRRGLWISGLFVDPEFRASALAELLGRELLSRAPETGARTAYTRLRLRDAYTQEALAKAGMEERYKLLRAPVILPDHRT